MKKEIKVTVVGLGYIGLPTAALMASQGVIVHGIDTNPKVVETINRGEIHIVEPDLDGLVKNCVSRGVFKASLKPESSDVFLVAVPTPFKENNQPDLRYVEAAASSVTSCLKEGDLFIIESTSPVGTTEHIYNQIIRQRPELTGKINVAYCPERVLPGNILHELKNNDRVIGGLNEHATEKACEFYARFVVGHLHKTNARTAEMCKLVENSFRDVNIAFANELSMICDRAKIDVWELIKLANKHPRVKILQPGPGVGGHCIAVDPWFIVSGYPEEARIIRTAREVNNHKTEWAINKIASLVKPFVNEHKRMPKLACLGLAFKPNIDDLRESPALFLVNKLKEMDLDVLPVEPYAKDFDKFRIYEMEEALAECDYVIVLVKHTAFENQSFQKPVLDFCGLLAK